MRKSIVMALALLLFSAGNAMAKTLSYNWAQITDELGDPITSNIQALIYTTAGATATIYSDKNGDTGKTNPISNPSNGIVGFYYDGDYDLVIKDTSTAKARQLTYEDLTVTDHRVIFPKNWDTLTLDTISSDDITLTGKLTLGEGIRGNYTLKTGTQAITLTAADAGVILFSTTTSCGVAVTLPSTTTACNTTTGNGLIYEFENYSTTCITYTITGAGSELINGSNTNSDLDTQYDYLKIQAFPGGWGITGRYIH